jgi:zinc transporter ZupT
MMLNTLVSAAIVISFVLVHVFGARLHFLSRTPRSTWLSGAGGVSVAYVFVHLLPELAEHQQTLAVEAEQAGLLASVESHAYLIALLGLAAFYGIERFAQSRAGSRESKRAEQAPLAVFWTHLGAFAVYNVLIGYLLVHREEPDLRGLVIYGVAMSLHFVVNDFGLREQHGSTYHRYGRWLLAIAPVLGTGIGLLSEISPTLLSSLFAFLAGGVILNVLKEELPQERESRFWAFAGGAALYSGLLLLTA